MASTASPSLAHRTVSSFRGGASGPSGPSGAAGGGSGSGGGGGGGGGGSGGSSSVPAPSTPGGHGGHMATSFHTPLRTTPSAFASPSAVRADEETIVVEVGVRQLRVGLAGDAVCRGTVAFGPEQQRRVGDLRVWQDGYQRDWRGAPGGGGTGERWDRAHELWRLDVRQTDLGLVGDKLERALREAFTKYLMIDSRPRRTVVVLPSGLPIPLIAATLDTLFGRFLAPSVALLSAPVAAAVAAGLRSALVVDLGWAETVVTSVYEYREVASARSVRGGRLLIQHTHDLLARQLAEQTGEDAPTVEHVLSFEECEDVAARLVWCRPARPRPPPRPRTSDGLPTVAETDETADELNQPQETEKGEDSPRSSAGTVRHRRSAHIPLQSCSPPTTLTVSFDQLASPCETAFFGADDASTSSEILPVSWDDEELPLPLLVFRHLLHLPVDVRAACMARLVFVGGGARVLGLRRRLFDELARLVAAHGWDGVRGRAVEQVRAARTQRQQERVAAATAATASETHHREPPAPEPDPVEAELRRARARSDSAAGYPSATPGSASTADGQLRAVDTLGAWSGASLLAQLRVPALAGVDRDQWALQGGAAGAARPADIDLKLLQRQSIIGPGSLGAGGPGAGAGGGATSSSSLLMMRSVAGGGSGAAGGAQGGAGQGGAGQGAGAGSWTLGVWGAV